MKTAEEILKERGSVYGPFDKLSEISQGIERLIIGGSKRTRFTAVQREAIKMVSSKLARLACGDPNHLDSWLDASNYLKLAHDDTLKKAKDWREAGEESLLLQCSPSGRCTASKANVVLAGGPGGRSNSIAAALGPASLVDL